MSLLQDTLLRLVRQSTVYALGNLLFKAAGFALAFIYLNPAYLSQEGFGYFDLLDATARIAIPLLSLGLASSLIKFMADPRHAGDHAAMPFTVLVASLGLAGAALALFGVLSLPLARLLLDDGALQPLWWWVGAYVALQLVAAVPQAYLRLRERVGVYVAAVGAEMVLLVAGVYFFLVVEGEGLGGIFKAYVLASAVSTALLTGGLLRVTRRAWAPHVLPALARFGVPLAVASIGTLFLNLGDRYLLKAMAGAEVVAVYAWAARLSGVLFLLVVQSFNAAFMVVGVKDLEGGTRETELHRRTFRHFTIWTGWAVLGLSLLAYDVTRWMARDPSYLQVETLVLPLALGFLFYGIYYIIVNVLFAGGRTHTIAVNLFVAAFFNAGLNVVLIPPLGAMGAALATIAAYVLLVGLTRRTARGLLTRELPWGVLARVLVLIGGLYAVGHLTLAWPTEARLALRLACIAAYPLLLLPLGLYRRAEVGAVLAAFRKRRR